MKNLKLLFVSLLVVFSACTGTQTGLKSSSNDKIRSLGNYDVAIWRGFTDAAVSYTFDDGIIRQFTVALPLFDQYGFKATIYVTTDFASSGSDTYADWQTIAAAAQNGHEMGNHSVSHPNITDSSIETEIAAAKTIINSHLPAGIDCNTLAYPFCVMPSDLSLLAPYCIAARVCDGQIVPPAIGDYYQISSISLGTEGINTTAGIIARFDEAVLKNGWCILLMHEIDEGDQYSPLSSIILKETLADLDQRRDEIWVSTFRDVVRYAKERDDLQIAETFESNRKIRMEAVTPTLDHSVYNHPLSFRRQLPKGWNVAAISIIQGGKRLESTVKADGEVNYILFDAVPNIPVYIEKE